MFCRRLQAVGVLVMLLLTTACLEDDGTNLLVSDSMDVSEDTAFTRRANADGGFSQIGSVNQIENGDLILFVDGETVDRIDAVGDRVASATRMGSGPGEWRYVLWAGADTLGVGVIDASNLRLVQLRPDLSAANEVRVPPVVTGGKVVGRMFDGSFVSLLDPPTIPGTGSQTFLTNLIRWTPGRDVVDTLTALPGTDVFIDPEEQMFVRVPGGRVDWAAARDSIIVAGNGHDDSVFVMVGNGPGAWVRLQLPSAQNQLTQADIESFVDAEVAQVSRLEDQRRMRRTFAKVQTPSRAPRYERLILDDLARIWCAVATDNNTRVWHVFSRTGELQTQVRLPAQARPWLINGRTIVATLADGDGFNKIVRFEMQ